MNRLDHVVLRVIVTSLLLCSCFAATMMAQTPTQTPSPSQEATKPPDKKEDPTKPPDKKEETKKEEANPFAPEPAPTLPPGMTGSDTNDPRSKLKPGVYDAGEASMGIKHLMLLKKPEAFSLNADDPN